MTQQFFPEYHLCPLVKKPILTKNAMYNATTFHHYINVTNSEYFRCTTQRTSKSSKMHQFIMILTIHVTVNSISLATPQWFS